MSSTNSLTYIFRRYQDWLGEQRRKKEREQARNEGIKSLDLIDQGVKKGGRFRELDEQEALKLGIQCEDFDLQAEGDALPFLRSSSPVQLEPDLNNLGERSALEIYQKMTGAEIGRWHFHEIYECQYW